MRFDTLPLSKNLLKGIEKAEFTECMPVQEMTYPHAFAGKDIFVQSQTGSGKTAAFLVPVFHLLETRKDLRDKKVLIICPTRELVVQIENEARVLGRYLPFRPGSFFGGVGYGNQEKLLREKVQILIGTPGRLIDFGQSGKINFREIGILVIDEADRMFDMGFYPDLRKMMRKMPAPGQRQCMLFSATMTPRVTRLAREFMKDPVRIEIAPENVTVETITQELYHVARREKMQLLLGLLKRENPYSTLIFTNTRHGAEEVARRLVINGYSAKRITGDLSQNERLRVMDKFKNRQLPILVATDVAARGLHIDDLDLVVNYDVPLDPENYVHRIGRTARAGKSGKAITLACEEFVYGLSPIEKYTGSEIPVFWADDPLYLEDKSEGMTFSLRRKPVRGHGKRRSGDKHPRSHQQKTTSSNRKRNTADSSRDKSGSGRSRNKKRRGGRKKSGGFSGRQRNK